MIKSIRKGAICSILSIGAFTAAATVFTSGVVVVASGVIAGAISNSVYLKIEDKITI